MPSPLKKIFVSASFEKDEGLFNWLKKFGSFYDDKYIYWKDFAFTTNLPGESDGVLILNHACEKFSIVTEEEKIMAFMMEPGILSDHPWMFRGLSQYSMVISPLHNSINTVPSHGYLGWYPEKDHNWFAELACPAKTKFISCIASDLKQLPGQRLRSDFINMLKQQSTSIDFYGKGSAYLPDKLDGLLPYKYSIAIENSSQPHYFTEKINDCFLAYTIPLYYGCTNISDYFPEGSYINLNINEPQEVLSVLNSLEQDDWKKRMPALLEARKMVLEKYNPVAGSAALFEQIPGSKKKEMKCYPVRPNIFDKISKLFQRISR